MSSIDIRDMDATTEYFVGTCTHVNESEEADACSKRRVRWLEEMHKKGLRVKVALLDKKPIGFLHAMPTEVCPWGPLGKNLLAVPCLFVLNEHKGKGAGSALIAEADKEAGHQGKRGLVTVGYYHDFWFMPAKFFERCGFSAVGKPREVTSEGEKEFLGKEVLLWRVSDPSIEPPKLLEPKYRFKPIAGKVVVDLFFNDFCGTSNVEGQRVREVVAEFGESVILNEYCADDPEILRQYQIPRGIYVNGAQIGWGYEAPREGIRKAISQALEKRDPQAGEPTDRRKRHE